MMVRRELLKTGGAALVIAAWPRAGGAVAPTIAGIVVDARFSEARAAHTPANAWRHEISGDVTALWYDRLDLDWRSAGGAVAGMTGADALFVLEHLAWDRQRRVILRDIAPAARGQVPLVRWIIAARSPAGVLA